MGSVSASTCEHEPTNNDSKGVADVCTSYYPSPRNISPVEVEHEARLLQSIQPPSHHGADGDLAAPMARFTAVPVTSRLSRTTATACPYTPMAG